MAGIDRFNLKTPRKILSIKSGEMMAFNDVVEVIKNLSTDEKQEIQLLLKFE